MSNDIKENAVIMPNRPKLNFNDVKDLPNLNKEVMPM